MTYGGGAFGRVRLLLSLVALALLFVAKPSRAYSVETQITPGCHERITADALRKVRQSLDTAKPIPLSGDENALLADMPFSVPRDMCDLGGMTLLVGVRDNDLKGIPATSVDELVEITAADDAQREHCLRTREEHEPGGTRQAVDDCRKYILDTLVSSLDGLDASGNPDPTLRQPVDLTLSVRGQTTVDLPIFYFRIGNAVHAIEDSFTHDWRSQSDPHKIVVALDWTDYADNTIDEPTTGPAHQSELDRCDDPDPLRAERRALATEAASAAMLVALDPTLSRDEKKAGFQRVLDAYVSYDDAAHCTYDNGWCNAPERQYATSSCACSHVGAARTSNGRALGLAIALAFVLATRRRRRSRGALRASLVATAIGLAIFSSRTARAAGEDAGTPPPATPGGEAVPGVPPPVNPQPMPETSSGAGPIKALAGQSSSGKPGVEDRAGAKFAEISIAASYDRSALMGRVGGRYALSRMWMVGLDAEWNPYIGVGQTNFRAGGLDVYASLIARFQLAYEPINLRSSASLGGSMLLFDLVGAPQGSVGPYFGLSLLGLEIKMGKGFYFTVDPDSIAVPIPHVTGVPFIYYQYRFQVGLEFGG